MPRKSPRSSKRGTKWKCPRCNRQLLLFVEVEIPPTCRNSSVHSTTTINMKEE